MEPIEFSVRATEDEFRSELGRLEATLFSQPLEAFDNEPAVLLKWLSLPGDPVQKAAFFERSSFMSRILLPPTRPSPRWWVSYSLVDDGLRITVLSRVSQSKYYQEFVEHLRNWVQHRNVSKRSQSQLEGQSKTGNELSQEDTEIAHLLAEGLNRQEIARRIKLSESEIRRRLYKISEIWGLERTSAIAPLANEARRRGYTS